MKILISDILSVLCIPSSQRRGSAKGTQVASPHSPWTSMILTNWQRMCHLLSPVVIQQCLHRLGEKFSRHHFLQMKTTTSSTICHLLMLPFARRWMALLTARAYPHSIRYCIASRTFVSLIKKPPSNHSLLTPL